MTRTASPAVATDTDGTTNGHCVRIQDAPERAQGARAFVASPENVGGLIAGDADALEGEITRCQVTLSLPYKALGKNQMLGSWRRTYALKQLVKRDTALLWREQGSPVFDRAHVTVRCVFGTGARRDPQNYAGGGTTAMILDSLTECGAWQDDRPPHMVIDMPEIVYERGQPGRIELTITEGERA